MQAGAFPGSPVGPALHVRFACYDIENVKIDRLRRRRATGPRSRPIARPARRWRRSRVESAIDELAKQARHGSDRAAPQERRQGGHQDGLRCRPSAPIGMVETLEAAKNHPHYKAPVRPNQGRGMASGFWFNIGGDSSAAIHVGDDGSVTVISGNPDIGGIARLARPDGGRGARHPYRQGAAGRSPTPHSIGYNDVTGGSRVTFATGMAVVELGARHDPRAARCAPPRSGRSIPTAVIWENGMAKPAGANVGSFEPLIARRARRAGRHAPAGRSPATPSSTSRAPGRASACTSSTSRSIAETGASQSSATPRCRMPARRSIRPMSRARSRAAPCRASAGR